MKNMPIRKIFRLDLKLIKANSAFIIFAIFIAAGVVAGVLCYKNIDIFKGEATELFDKHYQFHSKKNFFQIAGQTLLNFIPLILISFVVGTSAAGCVLVPVLPLTAGFLFGIISGYLYDSQQIMGVVYNLLVMLPSSLIAFLGLLLCCRESFGFSKLLASMCINSGRCFNLYSDFKNYCIRYIVIMALFIVYALIDASLASLFIKYFQF